MKETIDDVLNEFVNKIRQESARLIKRIQVLESLTTGPRIREVKVGDVWEYVPNKKAGLGNGPCEVVSINKKKNEVRFKDEGWNPISGNDGYGRPHGILNDPGWVLLGRKYKGKK